MGSADVADLIAFLRDNVGDNLRSVTTYDLGRDDYDIVYAREDVLAEYTEEAIDRLVSSYQWESTATFVEENRYEHGRLNCIVRSFEDGVEINLVDDGNGAGVAIGLEAGTFLAHNTFIGKCMELVHLD